MSSPIVKTIQGQLRGKVCQDHEGNAFFAFLGIPYAKPPVGELRFKAPQPAEAWEGVRDAIEDGNECYSLDMIFQKPVGSEDCLFLNVYTNEIPLNKNHLKPVMVWIHGGGFTSGSNKSTFYGPEFLIGEDVVIVSINYRLGALGFLSLSDPKLGVPGNAGLKDMVMALKWVKNNIQSFNGDPNNVTIFGESAGAAAVHYLMLSPMAKNLFHKVIALSGSATNIWACGRTGGEIATTVGCMSKDEHEILKFLQNLTKEELLQAQIKLQDPFVANKQRYFGPVVEKFNHYDECFLQDEPKNIILSGDYNKVPLIMGYTTREGMLCEFTAKDNKGNYRTNNFEKYIPYTLGLPKGSPLSLDVANRIKNFYFGDKDVESDETTDDYYKLQTDNFFLRGIYTAVKHHAKTSNNPVYLYRFSTESNLNMFKKICQIKSPGVCHADDLGYLFKNPLTPEIKSGSLEEVTMRRLLKYFSNFARHGDPNPKEFDDLFPVAWKPVTKDTVHFVDINENVTVGRNPENSRMEFWDSIFGINPVTAKL